MKGEKGEIKKFFSGLLALVVLGGATLGGLELWGKGKQKPSNWFKQEVAEEGGSDLIAGNVLMSDSEQSGIALTAYALSAEEYEANAVPAEAETAVKIKVNFTPANTTDKRLRASLSFKNAQSTWASGKTVSDYVTASVNQQEILLTCAEAFGEQIELRIDTNHENV